MLAARGDVNDVGEAEYGRGFILVGLPGAITQLAFLVPAERARVTRIENADGGGIRGGAAGESRGNQRDQQR